MYKETQDGVKRLQAEAEQLRGREIATADVLEIFRRAHIMQQTGVDIFTQYEKSEAIHKVQRRLGTLLKASEEDPGHGGELLKIVLSALSLQRKELLRIAIMPEEEEAETAKPQ
jgi:hypothetical protein